MDLRKSDRVLVVDEPFSAAATVPLILNQIQLANTKVEHSRNQTTWHDFAIGLHQATTMHQKLS
ncbi:hypothetical protein HanPSC8_Chr02g0083331 [Helianthus annuus]|nr:hypothetical protein HanPSC8_Chr02g0083331 [Helianthus annuus]